MDIHGRPEDVAILRGLTLDFRGHYRRGTARLHASIQWRDKDSKPSNLVLFENGCPFCELRAQKWTLQDGVYHPMNDCPNPDGIRMVWEQDFPSGKILVANDLRWLNRVPTGSLEGVFGVYQSILAFARIGMTVAFGIGNTCPSIFRDGDDGLVVRHRADGERGLYTVCTDLWAYSMIDLEEGRRRALAAGMSEPAFDNMLSTGDVRVLKVPPGKYRFEHLREEDMTINRGWPEWSVYTRIKRIGDADPVFDFVSWYYKLDVHVLQAASLTQLLKYARDLSIGIPSRDWHPNGFPLDIIHAADTPFTDVPIPPLEGPPLLAGTAPIYDLDVLCMGVEKWDYGHATLNKSHAILVGRILEHVLQHGLAYMRPEHQDIILKVPTYWRHLVAQHPHVKEAMPEFDMRVEAMTPADLQVLADEHLRSSPQ